MTMGFIKFLNKAFRLCGGSRNNHETAEVSPECMTAYPKNIISWSGTPTETYHWWPMKDMGSSPYGYRNNLYEINGGLDKYDVLFKTKAVEYQKNHYYRSSNSKESDADWAGFCDCAATLSCLYEYPKNTVCVKYNNEEILFRPRDIETLMIIACHDMVDDHNFEFYGERYNYKSDDTGEPNPIALVDILKTICQSDIPFAMDIAHKKAVWNYSYNNVNVYVTSIPPLVNTDKVLDLKSAGLTHLVYYNFIFQSDAYPDKNLNIWGWSGNIVTLTGMHSKSGWLSDKHPDFIWRKYPINEICPGPCKINPEISIQNVYEIYTSSLISDNISGIVNLSI